MYQRTSTCRSIAHCWLDRPSSGTYKQATRSTMKRAHLTTCLIHSSSSTFGSWSIYQDLLHIREYTKLTGASASATTSVGGAATTVSSLSPILSPVRHTTMTSVIGDPVKRLQYDSNMKEKYARECYERNGCDYDKAWANFLELQEAMLLPNDIFEVQPLWL
jgi:hypothetical protein